MDGVPQQPSTTSPVTSVFSVFVVVPASSFTEHRVEIQLQASFKLDFHVPWKRIWGLLRRLKFGTYIAHVACLDISGVGFYSSPLLSN